MIGMEATRLLVPASHGVGCNGIDHDLSCSQGTALYAHRVELVCDGCPADGRPADGRGPSLGHNELVGGLVRRWSGGQPPPQIVPAGDGADHCPFLSAVGFWSSCGRFADLAGVSFSEGCGAAVHWVGIYCQVPGCVRA